MPLVSGRVSFTSEIVDESRPLVESSPQSTPAPLVSNSQTGYSVDCKELVHVNGP